MSGKQLGKTAWMIALLMFIIYTVPAHAGKTCKYVDWNGNVCGRACTHYDNYCDTHYRELYEALEGYAAFAERYNQIADEYNSQSGGSSYGGSSSYGSGSSSYGGNSSYGSGSSSSKRKSSSTPRPTPTPKYIGKVYPEAASMADAADCVKELSDTVKLDKGNLTAYVYKAGADASKANQVFRDYQNVLTSKCDLTLRSDLSGSISVCDSADFIAFMKMIVLPGGDFGLLVIIPNIGPGQADETICRNAVDLVYEDLEKGDDYDLALSYLKDTETDSGKLTEYEKAEEIFSRLGSYKDSKELSRKARYLQAREHFLSGEYEDTVDLFKNGSDGLEAYEDSSDILAICEDIIASENVVLDGAQKLLDAGHPDAALELLLQINGREKTEKEISSIRESYPFLEAMPGDIISFGTYDGTTIEWRVLDRKNTDLFLITDKVIETLPYHNADTDVTWETCSLRKWLNNEFLKKCFTRNEYRLIKKVTVKNEENPVYQTSGGSNTKDKAFLLSAAEVQEYFPTEKERMVFSGNPAGNHSGTGQRTWSLRTPGKDGSRNCTVWNDGVILGIPEEKKTVSDVFLEGLSVTAREGIRPAIWMKAGIPLEQEE